MAEVDSGIPDATRSGSAEERLQAALQKFADVAKGQVQQVVSDVTHDLSSSVETLSQSAVKGLRQIKQELNVAEAVRAHPWRWVGGAALAGATAGAITQWGGPIGNADHRAAELPDAGSAHSLRGKFSNGALTHAALLLAEIGLAVFHSGLAKQKEVVHE